MKILYLFPRQLYETKMSIGRVLYGEAVSRQPGVTLKFWGEGWDGYDNSLSVAENIERSGEAWDILWAYKADRLKGFCDAPGKKVVCFNECWDRKYLDEAAGANVIIFHHSSDMRLWRDESLPSKPAIHHLLHGADSEYFHPRQKTIDCLASGVSSPAIYPLRERLHRFVREGRLPGITRPHPGYRLRSAAECRGQYRDYADDLGAAKIALCCSSKHRYPLAKYAEAMLAGCAVAGDMPDDELFRSTLGRHMIELDPAWDDIKIVGTIRDWLRQPNELQLLAEAGRQEVLRSFTTDHYAKRFIEAVGDRL